MGESIPVMMLKAQLKKRPAVSHLLPPPGHEVVMELIASHLLALDDISRDTLKARLKAMDERLLVCQTERERLRRIAAEDSIRCDSLRQERDNLREQNRELILEVKVRDGLISDEQNARATLEAEASNLRELERVPQEEIEELREEVQRVNVILDYWRHETVRQSAERRRQRDSAWRLVSLLNKSESEVKRLRGRYLAGELRTSEAENKRLREGISRLPRYTVQQGRFHIEEKPSAQGEFCMYDDALVLLDVDPAAESEKDEGCPVT